MATVKLGLCQMRVTEDKGANLEAAKSMIAKAAEKGARFVVLPEMFNCPYSSGKFPLYAEPEGGESCRALSEAAARNGVYLIGGSIPEERVGKIYNTSFVYGPGGELMGAHRKAHLFDINVPGKVRFMESETLSPGDSATVIDTEYGKIGVAICFDIRFSPFFAKMAEDGANIIFVPGAFNMTTGPAHWELSFRMRAVDNQLFIAGCAPARDESAPYISYGNSIVTTPWGEVAGRLGGEEGLLLAELDMDEIGRVRAALPIRSAMRRELY